MFCQMMELAIDVQQATTEVSRTVVEASALDLSRKALGDERVADWAFEQDYDAGFVGRNSNQLGELYEEKYCP